MTGGLPRPPDDPVGRYSWPWVVGAFLFVVVSPIAAAMTRSSRGSAFTAWLVVQILATALAWLIPEARQVLAGRKQATAEETEHAAARQPRRRGRPGQA